MHCKVAAVAKHDRVRVFAFTVITNGAKSVFERHVSRLFRNNALLCHSDRQCLLSRLFWRTRVLRLARSNHSFSSLSIMTSNISYEMAPVPVVLRSALRPSSQTWSVCPEGAFSLKLVSGHVTRPAAQSRLTLLVHVVLDLLCEIRLHGFCANVRGRGAISPHGQLSREAGGDGLRSLQSPCWGRANSREL